MSLRAAFALSILANAVFLGFLFFKKSPSNSGNSLPQNPSAPSTQRPAFAAGKTVRLDWRSVESADYKEYVKNLRAIGCPEETIFDIIVADVNTLFAMKARSLTTVKEWKYWEPDDGIPSKEEIRNQKLRRELESEKRALLAAILGPDALNKLKKYQLWGGEDLADRTLAFLADDKRNKLKNLQEKYFDLEQATTEWNSAGIMTEETMERLAQLKKQRRAEIESLLTPEELLDYDVRTSETADNLRQELAGFHPTEDEFRKLFEARRIHEEQMNSNLDVRDPGVLEARVETEKRLESSVKSDLGEKRFGELERSRDIDYQNTLRMTEFFGLPEKAANDVYDLKKRDQAQAEEINSDARLSDEQRNATLAQMQSGTEQELVKILGPRVFEEYRRSNRWWMRNQ